MHECYKNILSHTCTYSENSITDIIGTRDSVLYKEVAVRCCRESTKFICIINKYARKIFTLSVHVIDVS